ncbi:MAG: hypothetical protein JWQ04_656 [Pedosphaera sp.]|nr:hypothetical protein [Pedosphaera sp.]
MKPIALLTGEDGRSHSFKCEQIVDGVPVNPVLPNGFSHTANQGRPSRHLAWWCVPYIETETGDHPGFVKCWKGNTRYDVRCLDGGAWDRPTCWGMFATMEEALKCALVDGPSWRSKPTNKAAV